MNGLLVICIGNPARGDDAIGPLVAERLRSCCAGLPFTLIEDFQLQPEMVEDLRGCRHALIIDACVNVETPLTIKAVITPDSLGWCSHALTPEQLLGLFRQASQGAPAPEITVLGIHACSFELGAEPSASVTRWIIPIGDSIFQLISQPLPADLSLTEYLQNSLSTFAQQVEPNHA